MNTIDNIAAIATGTGGAISILRISGPDALGAARKIWVGQTIPGPENERRMLLGKVGLDQALAVYMKGPRSYTGDDVVEFHCHGGNAAARNVLSAALHAGCRMAEPGEFTFRAFVNGKLDLLQAEAVSEIVRSGSEHALRMAEKQLSGSVSTRLEALYDTLTELLTECESNLDFSEEMIQWDLPAGERFRAAETELAELIRGGKSGMVFRDGVNVVLAGRPNAGKSSLFNRLLGHDRSIVTAIPGTTRDTVEADTVLAEIPVRLTDTAGLRQSSDPIEQLGVERSNRSIRAAQIVFWLLDAASAERTEEIAALRAGASGKILVIWNKCDLADVSALPELPFPTVRISAETGENMKALEEEFRKLSVLESTAETLPEFAVNERSLGLLEEAQIALRSAGERFEAEEPELAAAELRRALEKLGEVTGKTAAPDVLARIFSKFCIGK